MKDVTTVAMMAGSKEQSLAGLLVCSMADSMDGMKVGLTAGYSEWRSAALMEPNLVGK